MTIIIPHHASGVGDPCVVVDIEAEVQVDGIALSSPVPIICITHAAKRIQVLMQEIRIVHIWHEASSHKCYRPVDCVSIEGTICLIIEGHPQLELKRASIKCRVQWQVIYPENSEPVA